MKLRVSTKFEILEGNLTKNEPLDGFDSPLQQQEHNDEETGSDEQPNGDPEEGVVSTRCVGGGGQQQRERAQMRRHSTHQHFLLARRSVEVLVNTLELISLQERQAH